MERKYYVYILLDPRWVGEWKFKSKTFNYKPFYIGKGKGDRLKSHLYPSSLKRNNIKNNIIKTLINEHESEPIMIKLYNELTEIEAFNLEIEIIKHFGRIDKNEGILANHTDGGEGHSGYNKPKPWLRKPVYQYKLTGEFIKKWDSLDSIKILGINVTNIPTSIKRGGSCENFIWSYKNLGEKIDSKLKYQMPIKYSKIKQLDKKTGCVIKTFNSALEIENELKLRSGARNKIYECINNKIKTAYGYKWEI